MGANSNIEWTHHTFNPWVGCTKVGPPCDNCYAEAWAKRAGHSELWDGERRRTTAANWRQPLKWDDEARAAGIRARVFCASLADVFDNVVPDQWREDLFRLILRTPNLDWMLLTKRPGNALHMLPADWGDGYPNVWLGATFGNQTELARDIVKLLRIRARLHFCSHEPGLGPLDLERIELADVEWTDGARGKMFINALRGSRQLNLQPLRLVITGGESGSKAKARQYKIEWARAVIGQCQRQGRAAFVKQLGVRPTWDGCAGPDERWPEGTQKHDRGRGYWEMALRDPKGGDMAEWPEDLRVRQIPESA